MSTVIGKVFKIYQKVWNDPKTGDDRILYSLKIDGDQEYYGFGTNRPPCQEGDNVEFQWSQRGKYRNGDHKSLKIVGADATPTTPPQQQSAPRAASSGGGNSRDAYWDNKDKYDKNVRQRLICYQSATKDAVTLAVAALNNGILPTSGQKKTDKYSSFIAMVNQMRDEIYTSYDVAIAKLEKDQPLVDPTIKSETPAPTHENEAPQAATAPVDDWAEDTPF